MKSENNYENMHHTKKNSEYLGKKKKNPYCFIFICNEIDAKGLSLEEIIKLRRLHNQSTYLYEYSNGVLLNRYSSLERIISSIVICSKRLL